MPSWKLNYLYSASIGEKKSSSESLLSDGATGDVPLKIDKSSESIDELQAELNKLETKNEKSPQNQPKQEHKKTKGDERYSKVLC